MNEIIVFIETPSEAGMVEITVSPTVTGADLLAHPLILAVLPDATDVLVFIDDSEEPLPHGHRIDHGGARHGSRIHASHHHRIQVEVYFQAGHHRHEFPPGARLRRVKEWAAEAVHLTAGDAVDHVLIIHGTADQPDAGATLSSLVHGREHRIAFDLVPDKRVEG